MQPHNPAVTRRNITPYDRCKIAALILLRLPMIPEGDRPIVRQATDYLTGSNSAAAQRFLPIETIELTKVERARVLDIIVGLTLLINDRETPYKRSVMDASRQDALLQRITELNADNEPEVLVAAAG